MQCITTVLIIENATVSKSQNVKDSSHANKYLRKRNFHFNLFECRCRMLQHHLANEVDQMQLSSPNC